MSFPGDVVAFGSRCLLLAAGVTGTFSPDGRWLLLHDKERASTLIELETLGARVLDWQVAGPVAFSADSHYLALPRGDDVAILTVPEGAVASRFSRRSLLPRKIPMGPLTVAISHLAFYGDYLLAGTHAVYPYHEADDRYERMAQDRVRYCIVRALFGGEIVHRFQASSRQISPRGRYWAMSSLDARRPFRLLDLKTMAPVLTRDRSFWNLTFSTDEHIVALVTQRQQGGMVRRLESDVAKPFATGVPYGLRHTIWLWDGETGLLRDALSGAVVHELGAFPLAALAASGEAAAGVDKRGARLLLRDLASGRQTSYEDERLSGPGQLSFSPDGGTLLVTGLRAQA